MALLKTYTVKELLLEAILTTYRERVRMGNCCMRTYKGIDKKFFGKILQGAFNFKLLIRHMMSKEENDIEENNDLGYNKYKSYEQVMNEFLGNEIHKVNKKETAVDIFWDIDMVKDEYE